MKQTRELLNRQMSRKEFVQFLGMGILAIFGFGNFLTYMRQNARQQSGATVAATQNSSKGFGSSRFGA